MGTERSDFDIEPKSLRSKRIVLDSTKAFPTETSSPKPNKLVSFETPSKSKTTVANPDISINQTSTYDKTPEVTLRSEDAQVNKPDNSVNPMLETNDKLIPPISNIFSKTSQNNKENQINPKTDTTIRFKPILESGNFNTATPKSKEVYQKNGLQTVFLPFKIQQSLLQNQIQPQNMTPPYLPPPVRQIKNPVNYTSQITFNSQNLAQVPLITSQAPIATQPQIPQQVPNLLHPQTYLQQAPTHMLPSPNLSVATPPLTHHSQVMNLPNSESIESIQVNQTLGQPISDEQLEARSHGMASFRLKSDAKRTLGNKNKPYKCSYLECEWSFARQSDLRRHSKSHAAPQYYCPYWRKDQTCHKNGGAFNRLDVLKRHLRLVHYIPDFHAGSVKSKNDSGWCKACQKMFANSKMFIEHCALCASSVAATKWSEVRADEFPSQQLEHQSLKHLAPHHPDEFFKDPSELYDPNSNLITLSTVINEFETQAKRKDI